MVFEGLPFGLFAIDDDRKLFISPAIKDWSHLDPHEIRVVFDLEGELDGGVPTCPTTPSTSTSRSATRSCPISSGCAGWPRSAPS